MHLIEYSYGVFFIINIVWRNRQIENNIYPLRNLDEYFIPRFNKGWLSRFLFYSFPTTWNVLDPTLKSLGAKSELKYKLETFSLKQTWKRMYEIILLQMFNLNFVKFLIKLCIVFIFVMYRICVSWSERGWVYNIILSS